MAKRNVDASFDIPCSTLKSMGKKMFFNIKGNRTEVYSPVSPGVSSVKLTVVGESKGSGYATVFSPKLPRSGMCKVSINNDGVRINNLKQLHRFKKDELDRYLWHRLNQNKDMRFTTDEKKFLSFFSDKHSTGFRMRHRVWGTKTCNFRRGTLKKLKVRGKMPYPICCFNKKEIRDVLKVLDVVSGDKVSVGTFARMGLLMAKKQKGINAQGYVSKNRCVHIGNNFFKNHKVESGVHRVRFSARESIMPKNRLPERYFGELLDGVLMDNERNRLIDNHVVDVIPLHTGGYDVYLKTSYKYVPNVASLTETDLQGIISESFTQN